jgi:hypothetical protein
VKTIEARLLPTGETLRAKYETAFHASQKTEPFFGYLKIRWGHV